MNGSLLLCEMLETSSVIESRGKLNEAESIEFSIIELNLRLLQPWKSFWFTYCAL